MDNIMDENEFEKRLTESEAEQLYRLLTKLDQEMHERIKTGNAFETGEVSYTTIVRDKKLKYLKNVYGAGSQSE
jgi:uncharacterized Fe-S cluster-containing radical SAM superfamily enzyme